MAQHLIAKALALLKDDPDQPVTKIAKTLGVSRQRLYELPDFTKARSMYKIGQKESRRQRIPKGEKDNHGNIEAWRKK